MNPEYQLGQKWKYKNRSRETESRLIITKIGPREEQGVIIHIWVDNLKLEGADELGIASDIISHIPIYDYALDSSVAGLEATAKEMPQGAESSYLQWKKAYESNEGGVFSRTVSDCVSFIEKGILVSLGRNVSTDDT